jgi:hypothetical protein
MEIQRFANQAYILGNGREDPATKVEIPEIVKISWFAQLE